MKLKKYKVVRKTPKPVMNAGRMVNLEHDKVVYLKEDRQVRVLVDQGYIKEIEDFKKQEKVEIKEEEKQESDVEEQNEESFYYKPKKKKGKKHKQKQEQSSAKEAEDQIEQE